MPNFSASNVSCGVHQMYGLGEGPFRNVEDAWFHYKEARKGNCRILLFSDADRLGNGMALATFLKENDFGDVFGTSSGTNPNSGNEIQAWLWIPEWSKIEAKLGPEILRRKEARKKYEPMVKAMIHESELMWGLEHPRERFGATDYHGWQMAWRKILADVTAMCKEEFGTEPWWPLGSTFDTHFGALRDEDIKRIVAERIAAGKPVPAKFLAVADKPKEEPVINPEPGTLGEILGVALATQKSETNLSRKLRKREAAKNQAGQTVSPYGGTITVEATKY